MREVLTVDTTDEAWRHRATAADWHDGQWSALYAYASTGSVLPTLLDEINQTMDELHPNAMVHSLDELRNHVASLVEASTVHVISATRLTDGTHLFMCGENAGRYDDAVKVHPVGNYMGRTSPEWDRVTCERCLTACKRNRS